MVLRRFLIFCIALAPHCVDAVARLNLFNPYDILLHPRLMPPGTHCLSAAIEGVVNQRGFQDDFGLDCRSFRRRCDVLQLWQDEQDGLAAFKGSLFDSELGQAANLFSRDDDDGDHALFIPCGKIAAQNLMLTYQYQWSSTTSWAIYVPIIHLAVKDVRFKELKNDNFFEATFVDNFAKFLEQKGHIALRGSSRTGIGEITTLVWWERGFPQLRPLLRNVILRVRGGFTFPVGDRGDCDDIFRLPLSYDASWGILGGATIEFHYSACVGLGIDVEVLNLFGSIRNRRVKTDLAQTDLLFLTKACTFKDPGFVQHYTIWGSAFLTQFLTFRIAYQYFKQQDDQLFVASQSIDAEIANTAESLLEWTTNSAVFQLYYEVPRGADACVYPRIGAWYKIGFNGKRAILADTVGFSLDIAF